MRKEKKVDDTTNTTAYSYLKEVLPENILLNSKNEALPPNELLTAILDLYDGKILDFVVGILAKWEEDIIGRLKISVDKEKLLLDEITEHALHGLNDRNPFEIIFEGDMAYYPHAPFGFEDAIKGINKPLPEIIMNYINYDTPVQLEDVTYSHIWIALGTMREYSLGYAHSFMMHRLRDNPKSYIGDKVNDSEDATISKQINTDKFKWLGKPAHLALIIDLLIDKGYMEATPYGERTAETLLQMFDFHKHKPSKESLGKLLHKDNYPINDPTSIELFKKIPKRSELK